MSLVTTLADRIDRLGRRRAVRPRGGRLRTRSRRIYLLPTRHGLWLAAILLVLVLGALNYDNSLAFGFAFLLASGALVSLFHSQRALTGLEIRVLPPAPVFAGGQARFTVLIRGTTTPPGSLVVTAPGAAGAAPDRPGPGGTAERVAELVFPAARRGWLHPGPLRLETRHPLGLVRAQAWLHPDVRGLVYPRPEPPQGPAHLGGREEAQDRPDEGGDFLGLRDYRPGDPPGRLTWKRPGAGGEPATKRFAGTREEPLWLAWDQVRGDTERRLSRLCGLVLEAGRGDRTFGLRLPGHTLQPAGGPQQVARALRLLALFGRPAGPEAAG